MDSAPEPHATEWKLEQLPDRAALEDFVSSTRAKLGSGLDLVSIDHELPYPELMVLAEWGSEGIAGLALLSVLAGPLVYSLGRYVLARWWVRKYELYQGPVSTTAHGEESLDRFFSTLARTIPNGGVIYLNTIDASSGLFKQLDTARSALRRRFFVLPWGELTTHCGINWTGSVDSYLATLGRSSRKDLRRCHQDLFSDPALRCELRRFSSPGEVDDFLRDGVQISNTTYQKKELGLGLSHQSHAEQTIRFAAERGAFLGYIFYINDAPVAFQYCLLSGTTCTMAQTGFDPQWSSRQVGAVLFLEILKDLERTRANFTFLDFSVHPTVFKLRTTNLHRQVRNFYLFKRTVIGAVQYSTLGALDAASRALKSLLRAIPRKKTR